MYCPWVNLPYYWKYRLGGKAFQFALNMYKGMTWTNILQLQDTMLIDKNSTGCNNSRIILGTSIKERMRGRQTFIQSVCYRYNQHAHTLPGQTEHKLPWVCSSAVVLFLNNSIYIMCSENLCMPDWNIQRRLDKTETKSSKSPAIMTKHYQQISQNS